MLQATPATHDDLDWMVRLYHQAAARGHFYSEYSLDVGSSIVARNLHSAIEQGTFVDFGLQARAIVFRAKRKRIGYVVMSSIRNIPDGSEIHMFIVDQKRRRHGFGRQTLRYILANWNQTSDLYARCYESSTGMIHLLESHQFVCTGTNSEGARVFHKPAMASDSASYARTISIAITNHHN